MLQNFPETRVMDFIPQESFFQVFSDWNWWKYLGTEMQGTYLEVLSPYKALVSPLKLQYKIFYNYQSIELIGEYTVQII